MMPSPRQSERMWPNTLQVRCALQYFDFGAASADSAQCFGLLQQMARDIWLWRLGCDSHTHSKGLGFSHKEPFVRSLVPSMETGSSAYECPVSSARVNTAQNA